MTTPSLKVRVRDLLLAFEEDLLPHSTYLRFTTVCLFLCVLWVLIIPVSLAVAEISIEKKKVCSTGDYWAFEGRSGHALIKVVLRILLVLQIAKLLYTVLLKLFCFGPRCRSSQTSAD